MDNERERERVKERIRALIDTDAKVKKIRRARRMRRNLRDCKGCKQLEKEENLLYYCKELKLNLKNLRYCKKWKEEDTNEPYQETNKAEKCGTCKYLATNNGEFVCAEMCCLPKPLSEVDNCMKWEEGISIRDFMTREEKTHNIVDKWVLTLQIIVNRDYCDYCGEELNFGCAHWKYIPSESQHIHYVCRDCYREHYKEEEKNG